MNNRIFSFPESGGPMKTRETLKKIGFILIAFLPFIAALVIQVAASLIGMFFLFLSVYLKSPLSFNSELFYNALLGTQFNSAVMVIYSMITVLLLGTWYKVASTPRRVPRRRISQVVRPGMLAALVILAASLQYLSSFLINFTAYLKPDWLKAYTVLLETAGMNDITLLLVLYSVIIGPVCEELIFRGVMLYYAQKALPFWAANLFQALLFGVYHMNIVQGIYAFLVGIFCGLIFHYGKSIYLSIGFHMLFNFWGTFLVFLIVGSSSSFVNMVIFAVTILLTAGGLLLYKRSAAARNKLSCTADAKLTL